MCIDATVKELLHGMLESEELWLLDSLDRVRSVTASRPHSPYGFEWLAHTAFAVHLLKRGGPTVTDIRIGLKEESSSKKPDIAFKVGCEAVAIQFKTVPSFNASAYQEDDVKKSLKSDHVYLLVVSYPDLSDSDAPADTVCTVAGPCGFLWRLRKIKAGPNKANSADTNNGAAD